MPSDGVCFEYAQSARRRSAFYAIPPRPMAMPLRCCGDACVLTARTSAFCIFLGRRGITVRTPPLCDRGFNIWHFISYFGFSLVTLFSSFPTKSISIWSKTKRDEKPINEIYPSRLIQQLHPSSQGLFWLLLYLT